MADKDYNINRSIGFLGSVVSEAMGIRLKKNFQKEGIDLPLSQFEVLITLYHTNGLCQQELACRLFRDKAAIKRTVDNLISKELVQRAQSSITKNNSVFLTEKAMLLETTIKQVALTTLQEGTTGIDPTALQTCIAVLWDIYNNNINSHKNS
jgi:DNA-binding MarR family transcriptional regulator